MTEEHMCMDDLEHFPNPRVHVHTNKLGAQPQVSWREEAEAALAFCKECRGWKNARIFNDCGYPFILEDVPKRLADTPIPAWERHFHFKHLEKVMQAVEEGCGPSRDLIVGRHGPSGIYCAAIYHHSTKDLVSALENPSQIAAVLLVCVNARKKEHVLPRQE
jgi:hypothetical protein